MNSNRPSKKNSSRGFTLLEVIIAIALVAILAAFALGNLDNVLGNNQERVTQTWIETSAKIPLTRYRVDMGSFPTTAEGLRALVERPAEGARWQGPYLERLPKDPWGTDYQYRFPGERNPQGYDLWSAGPDKTSATADDIGNWSTGD